MRFIQRFIFAVLFTISPRPNRTSKFPSIRLSIIHSLARTNVSSRLISYLFLLFLFSNIMYLLIGYLAVTIFTQYLCSFIHDTSVVRIANRANVMNLKLGCFVATLTTFRLVRCVQPWNINLLMVISGFPL
ncbi:MAG: hypothetical protein RCH30_2770 [Candidatus Phytoplasma australasiaticum]|nr:hypothetical protein EPWB_v2c3100 ['Echinacea purpurea' witches'-broom phytoplasma]WKV64157.1 MAG: hypothetical protein NCHU2022_c3120 [Candidatus Phytoplasma australasiaticum]WMW50165.1 MAG: hypothetical protein RCH30_2770 [Candidatus Phytoplasma australasiaticum]